MKTFIFAVILFSVIVLGITVNCIAVTRICDNLLDAVSDLPAAAEISGSEEEQMQLKALEQLWKKHYFLISLSTVHEDLERIDECLSSLRCALVTCDTERYLEALNLLILRFEQLKNLSAASFDNIL